MWVVQAAFVVVGPILALLGIVGIRYALRDIGEWRNHRGTLPLEPLIHAAVPGQRVHVIGTIVSPDHASSPAGRRSSAYLDVELAQVNEGGKPIRTFLKEVHGESLWIDDGTAVGFVKMAHADVLDRAPFERMWPPTDRPPAIVLDVLAARKQAPPRPLAMGNGPDMRYRETALRHGEPLRVHGVVLEVHPAPAGGRPTVVLGTDQRSWLRVSNMTDSDLAHLRRRAVRWAGGAVLLVVLGLAMAVGGTAWAVQARGSEASTSAASGTTVGRC